VRASHRLVEEDDQRRVVAIAGRESSSLNQAKADCRKVRGAHDLEAMVMLVSTGNATRTPPVGMAVFSAASMLYPTTTPQSPPAPARRLDLSGSDPFDPAVVEAAARRWGTRQIRRHRTTAAALSTRTFRYWAHLHRRA
jgi:hypothetical protein